MMTYEPQKRHFIINVFGVHIMTDNVSHFSTTRKCPYIRWAMHFDATVVQYRKIVVQYRKMIRYCDRIYSLPSLFSLSRMEAMATNTLSLPKYLLAAGAGAAAHHVHH